MADIPMTIDEQRMLTRALFDSAQIIDCGGKQMAEWTQELIEAQKADVPVRWDSIDWESFCDLAARGLAAESDAAKARAWLPIESAPHGRNLIVGYPNKLGNWRTIIGHYYRAGTLQASEAADDADSDGYAPEGWYEESESHEYILRTDEPPTHWMPLCPEPTGETK